MNHLRIAACRDVVRSCTRIALAVTVIGCGSDRRERLSETNASSHDTPLTRNGAVAEFDRPSCGAFDIDGRLVVCEAAERQVLVFDSAGQHRFTFGKRGAGPGEFHTLAGVQFDKTRSLLVWDGGRRKLVAIDESGRMLYDKQFAQLRGWIPRYLGQTSGGRLIFLERTSFVPRIGELEGMVRQWTRVLAFDSATRKSTVVDSIILSEAFARGRGFQRVTFAVPFGANGEAVLSADRIIRGFSRDSFLVATELMGGHVDTIQLDLPLYPVSEKDWQERWDTLVARSSPEFRDRIIDAKSEVPRATHHPRFVRLLVTPRGTIAAYIPADSTRRSYEIRCVEIAAGDICPSIRTVQGEVVLAINSGAAAVAIEQSDGTWRIVKRAARLTTD